MPPSFGSAWDSLDSMFGCFLKDPWLVLWNVFPEFSNANTTVYKFITYHMNFVKNEHVKLNETCLDTQGRFKPHFLNIMDILGLLTSKLNETQHTSYICNNKSSKELITSLIRHNHIKPHIRPIVDLAVERLSHPLTIHFQYP